jgi:hypothetical protein
LLIAVFGENSIHVENFKKVSSGIHQADFESPKAVFLAGKEDYEKGFATSLSKSISGELFGDFVKLAKQCLEEGQKDPAAILASAALEDALKRYAAMNEVEVYDKGMPEVVSALKAKGLIGGAQKSLLDVMPKLRDYSMHANWDKIKPEGVASMIGFVEQFLVEHF